MVIFLYNLHFFRNLSLNFVEFKTMLQWTVTKRFVCIWNHWEQSTFCIQKWCDSQLLLSCLECVVEVVHGVRLRQFVILDQIWSEMRFILHNNKNTQNFLTYLNGSTGKKGNGYTSKEGYSVKRCFLPCQQWSSWASS